jgi:PAS domain S-box-containing protein
MLAASSGVTELSADLTSKALAAVSRPIVVTDATQPDNPIVYCNAAFASLFGYAVAEVVGRNCRFLQGPDSDPVVIADIRASVAAGDGIRREILNYRKDGTSFWNDLTIDPIRDAAGRLTGFIGTQGHADAAHRAVQEKAEADSRLASIADHLPGYIYRRIMRSDGSIEMVYCSPSIHKLLGIDAIDAPLTFYNHVHPDDIDVLTASIRRSAAEMSVFREEFRFVWSTGLVHWLRSEAPPRRLANGDIVWDGLALEISAEKRWETEIASQALRDPLTGLLPLVAAQSGPPSPSRQRIWLGRQLAARKFHRSRLPSPTLSIERTPQRPMVVWSSFSMICSASSRQYPAALSEVATLHP